MTSTGNHDITSIGGDDAGQPQHRSSLSNGIRRETAGVPMTRRHSDQDDVSAALRAIEQGMINLSDTSDSYVSPLSPIGATSDAEKESPSSRSVEDVSKLYAPPGMDGPFQQLYRALLPCLTNEMTKKGHQRPNVSVFIHGPRGSGKSLLVQSCLNALRCEESSSSSAQLFRPVFCSSAVHVPFQRRHSNAGAGPVVEEILRQLVEQAGAASSSTSSLHADLVRLRQSSFTNHLQLLNEMLQIASTDGIPVLFILDNVSRFPPLLLYHLLDRIAGSGTNTGTNNSTYSLCLVAMATHALTNENSSSFIEKRISSRVEGTASMIHLPATSCSSQRLLEAVLPTSLLSMAAQLYKDESLAHALKRQERMGKSARWFCRLFYSALATWREEIRRKGTTQLNDCDFVLFVRENLEELGVAIDDAGSDHPTPSKRRRRSSPASILQDLSVSQLLLVLAATRIIARGNRSKPSAADRAATSSSGTATALTLQGMLTEVVDKLYRGNPPPNATSIALKRAFLDLLDMAVVRPASDHSGIGPYQYYERDDVLDTASWDVLLRLPLHLTLDVYRDVLPALESKELSAPMTVLEWGRKLN